MTPPPAAPPDATDPPPKSESWRAYERLLERADGPDSGRLYPAGADSHGVPDVEC
jgi:hypothetical protein